MSFPSSYFNVHTGRPSLRTIALVGRLNPISPRTQDETNNTEQAQRRQQATETIKPLQDDQAHTTEFHLDQRIVQECVIQNPFVYASDQGVKETSRRLYPEVNDDLGSKDVMGYHEENFSVVSSHGLTADGSPAQKTTTKTNSLVRSRNKIYNYQDYVDFPFPSLKRRKTRGGVGTPFPEQLHRMLEECEVGGFSDIISWQPHGRSFSVHNRGLFQTQVLPNYFKTCNIASFQRQLNLYGFLRMRREGSLDRGSYFHSRFLRGMPSLCVGIQRTRSGQHVRVYLPPHMEPNFNALPHAPASSCSSLSQPVSGYAKRGNDIEGESSLHKKEKQSDPSAGSLYQTVKSNLSADDVKRGNGIKGEASIHMKEKQSDSSVGRLYETAKSNIFADDARRGNDIGGEASIHMKEKQSDSGVSSLYLTAKSNLSADNVRRGNDIEGEASIHMKEKQSDSSARSLYQAAKSNLSVDNSLCFDETNALQDTTTRKLEVTGKMDTSQKPMSNELHNSLQYHGIDSSIQQQDNSCSSYAGFVAVPAALDLKTETQISVSLSTEQKEDDSDPLLKYFLEMREMGGARSPPCAADILLDLDL